MLGLPLDTFPQCSHYKWPDCAMLKVMHSDLPFHCPKHYFYTDPNTDVIYISPVKISKEVEDYYQQLLAMRPAPHGNYWLLHPENVHKFCKQNMALATLMKYSPRAMKR